MQLEDHAALQKIKNLEKEIERNRIQELELKQALKESQNVPKTQESSQTSSKSDDQSSLHQEYEEVYSIQQYFSLCSALFLIHFTLTIFFFLNNFFSTSLICTGGIVIKENSLCYVVNALEWRKGRSVYRPESFEFDL